MKLELKNSAPYLPYKLKIFVESDGFLQNDETFEVNAITQNGVNVTTKRFPFNTDYSFDEFKLILRSDLTKEIIDEMQGSYYFDPSTEKWTEFDSMCDDPVYWSYSDVQILLKHHYDISNLIENNLAIDINTINQ